MSAFRAALAQAHPPPRRPPPTRWIYTPYDQLSCDIGPLSRADPQTTGVLLIESPWKASQRPYHRQKLATVLASGRHFALELAQRGFTVRVETARGPYRDHLGAARARLGPLTLMVPAERELREDLRPLVDEGLLEQVPHEGWLSTDDDFRASAGATPPWRMDSFYRHMRQRTGLLMDARGKPQGGRLSFDADNRQRWRGAPAAADPPRFAVDPITAEVGALIERDFAAHPGLLDLPQLAARSADVEALWRWAKESCLPTFGPYEDAMSRRSSTLFHTRISPLLNLHRLLPARVVREAAALDAPLASREGFVRQVLGWREFVRHVHVHTDGFRAHAPRGPAAPPGDGGWSTWTGRAWPTAASPAPGGAQPDALDADLPIPAAYWGTPSGFACLDSVVADVWREAYSHHITRLMVLSNWATLLGVQPRTLADWFWVAYADAYDWVVEPNVLGMGTFAAGPVMTTKPYVSGAAYIARMSDYCGGCAFDPATTCPMTRLYWAFLARSAPTLAEAARMGPVLTSAARRAPAEQARDAELRGRVRDGLRRGEVLTPLGLG